MTIEASRSVDSIVCAAGGGMDVTEKSEKVLKCNDWLVDEKYCQEYNATKYNKGRKSMISENLLTLRKMNKLSQEQVAEAAGVSRQAYTRWEKGETAPDIKNCAALADFYGVSLDELVNFSGQKSGNLPVPPRGKHLFGVVNVSEKGQIVLPKKARDVFGIKAGDRLIVLGDEQQGIALLPEKKMLEFMQAVEREG